MTAPWGNAVVEAGAAEVRRETFLSARDLPAGMQDMGTGQLAALEHQMLSTSAGVCPGSGRKSWFGREDSALRMLFDERAVFDSDEHAHEWLRRTVPNAASGLPSLPVNVPGDAGYVFAGEPVQGGGTMFVYHFRVGATVARVTACSGPYAEKQLLLGDVYPLAKRAAEIVRTAEGAWRQGLAERARRLGERSNSGASSRDATVAAEKRESGIAPAEHARAVPAAQTVPPPATDDGQSDVWRPGLLIDDTYEVLSLLGQGGMGQVFKVHHRGWGVDLAVKVPRPGLFSGEKRRLSFTREAETWVNLGLHPHVVTCFYVRTLGGVPRIFAEYVDGRSLSELIDARGLYDGGPGAALERILDIAIQAAWGLVFAHRHGLIHQDVKPSNIMVSSGGVAKITDFGLARALSVSSTEDETRAPAPRASGFVSVAGMTLAFCSPEQAGRRRLSKQTDVWSWALSVLEMFTGRVTWNSGEDARSALEAYVRSEHRDEPAIPRMPDKLRRILAQCFEEDPANRPDDLQALAAQLVQIATQTGGRYERSGSSLEIQLADTLNNRAVSLIDLGRHEQARQCLEQARESDPLHLAAAYNRLLLDWRAGAITDRDATSLFLNFETQQAQAPEANWAGGWLAAESGNAEAARKKFNRALELAGRTPEVQAGLRAANVDLISRLWVAEKPHSRDSLAPRSVHVGSRSHLVVASEMILSAGLDGRVRCWDSSGSNTRTFAAHDGPIVGLHLAANGRHLVSVGVDRVARLWDIADEKVITVKLSSTPRWTSATTDCMHVMVAASGGALLSVDFAQNQSWACFEGTDISHVAVSDDGKTAVSLLDGRVCLWSGGQWNTLAPERDSTSNSRLMMSPDGEFLVASSGQGTMVFSLRNEPRVAWSDPSSALLGASLSNRRIILFEHGVGLSIRELETGERSGSKKGLGPVRTRPWSAQLAPNGRWLATLAEREIVLYDARAGRCLRTFRGDNYEGLAWSEDSKSLFAFGLPRIAQYSVADPPRAPLFVTRPRPVEQLSRNAEQHSAAIQAGWDALRANDLSRAIAEHARAHDVPGFGQAGATRSLERAIAKRTYRRGFRGAWMSNRLEGGGTVSMLSAEGDRALVRDSAGLGTLWDMDEMRPLRALTGAVSNQSPLALSKDGLRALLADADGGVALWETTTGVPIRTLDSVASALKRCAISADNGFAAAICVDQKVRAWDLKSGRCVGVAPANRFRLMGHADKDDEPVSIAISDDGALVFVGTKYSWVWAWDKCSDRFAWAVNANPVQVHGITGIACAGNRIATSSADGTVELRDTQTGASVAKMGKAGDDWFEGVALTEGAEIAFALRFDKISVFDTSSGKIVTTLHSDVSAQFLAASNDASTCLTVNEDGTVGVWRLEWERTVTPPEMPKAEPRPVAGPGELICASCGAVQRDHYKFCLRCNGLIREG